MAETDMNVLRWPVSVPKPRVMSLGGPIQGRIRRQYRLGGLLTKQREGGIHQQLSKSTEHEACFFIFGSFVMYFDHRAQD